MQIKIIDETIREGMQYRGVMFSLEQRLSILEFQNNLNIDICQAGYPSAHAQEAKTVAAMTAYARKNNWEIRIAAMGRATLQDAQIMLATGADDLHFHAHIKNDLPDDDRKKVIDSLLETAAFVRQNNTSASISLALLDIGRSDPGILKQTLKDLHQSEYNLLSLPDTSGMMAPNQIFERIKDVTNEPWAPQISVHCHNDLGMASANTLMGGVAGASAIEASALGIGERNGIADLYTTATHLKNQKYNVRIDTDNAAEFEKYYNFVSSAVFEQTGICLLNANTPKFGDAVKTHVAGTHAQGQFGISAAKEYYLNVLCGRHLVKKYLERQQIDCPSHLLDHLTDGIKTLCVQKNRSATPSDVIKLISSLSG